MMKRYSLCLVILLLTFIGIIEAYGQVTIDYKSLGTFSTPSLNEGGVTVAGSDDVYVLDQNGLGIVGGMDKEVIDGSEYIHFEFNDVLAMDVQYLVKSCGNVDGGALGEAFIEAFTYDGTSLGTVSVDDVGWKNVSDLFGNQILSAFRVTADVDPHRISDLVYTPISPEEAIDLLIDTIIGSVESLSSEYRLYSYQARILLNKLQMVSLFIDRRPFFAKLWLWSFIFKVPGFLDSEDGQPLINKARYVIDHI